MVKTYWGVDSSKTVTRDLYNSVLKNFGKPLFWGRYLTTVEDASEGLTREEIKLLHNSATKVLPIYNNFASSEGYRSGMTSAVDAVSSARRLGIPKGVPIFAKGEQSLEFDAEWLHGWYEGVQSRGYLAGYFNDPSEGNFNSAYSRAAQNSERIPIDTILWSAVPDRGPSKSGNAPRFNPRSPSSKGNVWSWQYGRDPKACPINTNLATRQLFDILW
ncbi:glycoside hydrolase domain-containing protein [Bacillus sp. AK031]